MRSVVSGAPINLPIGLVYPLMMLWTAPTRRHLGAKMVVILSDRNFSYWLLEDIANKLIASDLLD